MKEKLEKYAFTSASLLALCWFAACGNSKGNNQTAEDHHQVTKTVIKICKSVTR